MRGRDGFPSTSRLKSKRGIYEEMEGFYGAQSSSLEEYDGDYEFDAPRCYDFCRMETDWEIEDAERWFDTAGTYPPSPIIAKIDGAKMHLKVHIEEENHRQMDSTINEDCTVEPETPSSIQSSLVQESRVLPKKSAVKPSLAMTSTLMKPTISHLAKLRTCQEIQCNRFLRSQRFTVKDQVTNSPYSSIIDNSTTKRQKLEGGYLRKAADLKHHPVLQHKLSKKQIGENIELLHSTVKLTVPREPHLETAHRTRMHRSMSDDGTISKKFQVNHKPRAHSPDKELNISMSKHDATISSFQKLTLKHETETRSDSQSKCLKENVPFTQPVQEVVKVTGRKGNSSAGVGKQLLQGKCRK